jgi:hypothetical protein
MDIITIVVVAVLLEAIVSYVRTWFVDKKIQWQVIATVIGGILLAILTNVDLLAAVGVTFVVPYVGVVLTGVILSRGSNYVFEFIKLVQGVTNKTTNK